MSPHLRRAVDDARFTLEAAFGHRVLQGPANELEAHLFDALKALHAAARCEQPDPAPAEAPELVPVGQPDIRD